MPQPNRPRLEVQILTVLLCAMAYFYAFELNWFLFNSFEFSAGVNWVYIPSGLRLLFILVLVETGALGIVVGSLAVNYYLGAEQSHAFNIVTALISGGAPYLSRQLAVHFLKLSTTLQGLTSQGFFKISLLFAATNALLHQAWFFWNDKTENLAASIFAMAVGDWFGTVLVLATASLVIKAFRWSAPRSPL